MSPRLARALVRLYPRTFRARYGPEYVAFLEDRAPGLGALGDVVRGALRAHLAGRGLMTRPTGHAAFTWMTWAVFAAGAAGLNFYYAVDDTPLALAMHTSRPLALSFDLVAAAALIFLAVSAVLAAVLALRLATGQPAERRGLPWLAGPAVGALVTLGWFVAVGRWNALHYGQVWIPLPWDVGGDWVAPTTWPPFGVRWPESTVTAVLFGAGLVTGAMSLARAAGHLTPPRDRLTWLGVAARILALAIGAMTLGVGGWGLAADTVARSAFHLRDGGVFLSTDAASWALSAIGLVVAAALAVRASQLARLDPVGS